MEEVTNSRAKTYMVCFWVAVAVVFVLFILPVGSHSIHSPNGEITFSYTLWDKLTDGGPKTAEIRTNH